jgi:thiamine transporter ThiT
MSAGFVTFAAGTVAGAAGIAVMACRTAAVHGGVPAAKEAVVTSVSLAVYAMVCISLHYGFAAQSLACVLSLVPLILGRRWIPSLAAIFGGPDA